MTDPTSPPDSTARRRIVSDIATNLFVEAGAGAGKTSSLVGRIRTLVADGVAIDGIAAITFTEKAAAELRQRVRLELRKAAVDSTDSQLVGRFEAALDRLDHAPIGTLHSFARRLLNEFPIEANLPPGFAVLDELESNLAFEERWEDLLDDLLSVPEPAEGPVAGGSTFVQVCRFRNFGLQKAFRRIAADFHSNWDLVAERVSLDPPADWYPSVTALVNALDAICHSDCPDGDRQTAVVGDARAAMASLTAGQSLISLLNGAEEAEKVCTRGVKAGNKANWKRDRTVDDLEALRAQHACAADIAAQILKEATEYRKHLVGAVLGRWVLTSAQMRAREGTLEFHDLLVLARRLLATNRNVREQLHARYQRVLLDEFQDTDPIQLAIAVRLTSDPADPAHDSDWTALRPLPGRIFIVGDPKQSIYRFRRADIAQYLRAADQIGADTEYLTANFRSTSAVIDWVNTVFGEVIQYSEDAQPGYQPLSVCRPENTNHGSVHVLGVDLHDDLDNRGGADELRAREAADVVNAVATALADGWLVGDHDAVDDSRGIDAVQTPILRPCRPGDITILLPARTSLPALESALRSQGLPYRAENSAVVYTTNEVRHLMLALRAADDTTDELALVAALRSPLYGCSDVELFEWKQEGGRWTLWSDIPIELRNHRVALGIEHLRTLATRKTTEPPADLVAALVDERRVLDAALDDTEARDVWRRMRYVIEQARAWSDAGGHGLRRYLAWVRLQAAESRAADTILPEHDHDAIRVMTIHAAKGLEFPITILTGLTTRPVRAGGYNVIWPDDTWGLAHKDDDVFDEYKPVDEQMSDAERRRLLYVGCTRAVDHLVVSLHRLARNVADPTKMTSAELLEQSGAAAPEIASTVDSESEHYEPPAGSSTELDWADRDEWAAERASAFAMARRRDTISATAVAEQLAPSDLFAAAPDAGLAKEPVDLDLPPWQRGRYGTAVGRAVHAVLQFADLSTGHDIDAHASAQCAAEGIIGMDDTVAALSRSAISAPIVQAALEMQHHRELFVAADVGGKVLEGYIDLLVQTPDGPVIVDYKTDQWPDHDERASRIEKYRRQLAAYGVALENVTGQPVAGGVLVRCRPDGAAEEIIIDGWNDALAELRISIGTL
jgi:ATP-dependent helicase/nuclease subunit A